MSREPLADEDTLIYVWKDTWTIRAPSAFITQSWRDIIPSARRHRPNPLYLNPFSFFHLTDILIGNFQMVFNVKMGWRESRRLVVLYLLCLFTNLLLVYFFRLYSEGLFGWMCLPAHCTLPLFHHSSFLFLFSFSSIIVSRVSHHYGYDVLILMDGCKM